MSATVEMHIAALEEIATGDFRPGMESRARAIRHHQSGLKEISGGEPYQVQPIIVIGRVSNLEREDDPRPEAIPVEGTRLKD